MMALQAPLNGQETIQPQRIINLDKFLPSGSASKPPQFRTAKLDFGLSKFKKAITTPAYASKPQISFGNVESVGYQQAARGFADQVPNIQATPNFQPANGFQPAPRIQSPQNFLPNPGGQQFPGLQSAAPIQRAPNFQADPMSAVPGLSTPPLNVQGLATQTPIEPLTGSRTPLNKPQEPVEFELLPTFPGSPPGSSDDAQERLPGIGSTGSVGSVGSVGSENFNNPASNSEAPLSLTQPNNRPSSGTTNYQPNGYVNPHGSVAPTTQQPPQYGSQPIPQYGSQPIPQYGSQPIPQYGSQPIQQYGSQSNSPRNPLAYSPTAPLPSYPVAPELGFPGGATGYEEVGVISPAHWGVDTQSQFAPQQPAHQFIDPATGTLVSVPGAIGPGHLRVGPNSGSFPINPGKREQIPFNRVGSLGDVGKSYDFQTKKKEFPPLSETLATGRYFASAELLIIKPHFQNNNAILIDSPATNFGSSQTFDFSFDAASRFRVGFESKQGPGFELNYFQYDHDSSLSSFTSDGIATGTSGVFLTSPNATSSIVAQNAGEVLTATQSLEVHRIGATFFKDFQLPVTRLGGGLGFQQVRINQTFNAAVTDATGTEVASLDSNHRFDAFGPQLYFRYFRPVGHTKLELIGGISGAVLFGNRDLNVQNSVTGGFDQVGSNDVLMLFDVLAGLQYVRNTAENRSFYARVTVMNEIWVGGGTAVSTADNFGFRGVGFGVGFNR